VVCLSIPRTLSKRLLHLGDVCLSLTPFNGDPPTEMKEYDGIFTIKKLPIINSLVFSSTTSFDSLRFFFKMTRRKFVIEPISLPPEHLQGVHDRPEQGVSKTLDLSCMPQMQSSKKLSSESSNPSNIDF